MRAERSANERLTSDTQQVSKHWLKLRVNSSAARYATRSFSCSDLKDVLHLGHLDQEEESGARVDVPQGVGALVAVAVPPFRQELGGGFVTGRWPLVANASALEVRLADQQAVERGHQAVLGRSHAFLFEVEEQLQTSNAPNHGDEPWRKKKKKYICIQGNTISHRDVLPVAERLKTN